MGFFLRKAISLGPLRLNLSGSGLGISAGVKGLRVGIGPRGSYLHAGRGGLYYRTSLGSPAAASQRAGGYLAERNTSTAAILDEYESGPAAELSTATNAQLLAELRSRRKRPRMLAIAITLTGIAAMLSFAVTSSILASGLILFAGLVFCWMARRRDIQAGIVTIVYRMDAETTDRFGALSDAFESAAASSAVWRVDSSSTVAGLGSADGISQVDRHRTTITFGDPPNIAMNLPVPIIPTGKQLLAFLPDQLLVYEAETVGAVAYDDLITHVSPVLVVEDSSRPDDATVVETIWRHSNLDGTPDRRYKSNHVSEVCQYDQIHFSSQSGLNEAVLLSRIGTGRAMMSALYGMQVVGLVSARQSQVTNNLVQ